MHNDIIDDDKIRMLAFEDRWHYVAILVCKNTGMLDCGSAILDRKLGVKLGLSTRELEETKRRLMEVELIDDDWQPIAWDERQQSGDPAAAERQRKYRERMANRITSRNVTHNVTATLQVEEEVEVEVEKELKERGPKRKRFAPPTLDDVAERCREMGYTVNPERFIAHYSANGWKVGRNPMKCWKSALAGWQSRDNEKPQKSRSTSLADDLTDTSWAK